MKKSKIKEAQEDLMAEFSNITSEYFNLKFEEPIIKYNIDNFIRLRNNLGVIITVIVITSFNLINDYLDTFIVDYYFPLKLKIKNKKLKRQLFQQQILNNMFLMHKLDLCHKISPFPKKIKSNIANINDIRNAFAHSLFPETRKIDKTFYRGKLIYRFEGIELFRKDMLEIQDYLLGSIMK